jgi:hypothetical protein
VYAGVWLAAAGLQQDVPCLAFLFTYLGMQAAQPFVTPICWSYHQADERFELLLHL